MTIRKLINTLPSQINEKIAGFNDPLLDEEVSSKNKQILIDSINKINDAEKRMILVTLLSKIN